eukprot:2617057-Prymnesium_polylepis.2
MGVGGAVGVPSTARGTPRGAHGVAQNEATFASVLRRRLLRRWDGSGLRCGQAQGPELRLRI